MPILADIVDAVIGIDTHRDTHHVEIALPTGAPIATTTITNDSRGYAALLAWVAEHAPGPRLAASIEGTRSYGAGVTRAVTAAGLAVIEAEQPTRRSRRGRGKSDPIDAHLAVTYALQRDLDRLPTPRADGDREALRILLEARHDLTTTSTAQINRLRALLRDGGDNSNSDHSNGDHSNGDHSNGDHGNGDHGNGDHDGRLARGALTDTILATVARRRLPRDASRAQAVRHGEIRRLALAVREARHALKTNHTALQVIVDELAPGLTDRRGLGAVTAAQVIVSFSHPGRVRSEAAFAALAGASPLQASSGQTVRHRLNRGGDRALNRALHTIALTRMAHCPRTRAYVARRRAQGKNSREIRRCLKRYIARELYRTLTTTMTNASEVGA